MNDIVQQASEADIASFFNNAKDVKKRKVEKDMNHIDEELDDMSLRGSVISAVYGMEDIPGDA